MKKVSVSVIIIIIAALSFQLGSRYGRDQIGGPDSRAEREVLYYLDPMNPGFRSEKPGIAPCGMPLEPVYAEAGDEPDGAATGADPLSAGTVKVNLTRRQVIGVNVNPGELKPMHYNLRLYGKIVPDETKTYQINASTDSWVRTLSDITTGSIVTKNQILAEVLAPAFYNAQVTYLVAMDNIDRIKQQLGGQLRHQQADLADNQIRVSVQSLQNLGITDAQVEELAKTRQAQPYLQVRSPVNGVVMDRNLTLYQWFKAGVEFYRIIDLGRVWVYADVYEDEARYLRPGMAVQVKHPQLGKTFAARVSRVLPLFDPVAKTLKVRIDVDNPRYDLRPDMFVDVEIPITMPPSLHVPADAVIDSGTKKIVYVEIASGTFEPRLVETGWRLGRQIEITSGLMPGEKVIVSGNFLIDSESRMKTAAAGIDTDDLPVRMDPVCGMTVVDEEKARLAGNIAEYGNETYYFCMTKCKDKFTNEPEKYAPRKTTESMEETRPAMTGTDHGWLEMLAAARGSQGLAKDEAYPKKETTGSRRTASIPGIVDWDGPDRAGNEAQPRDWSGWGKFPGAQYLGMEDTAKKKPVQMQNMPEAGKKLGAPADEQNSPAVSATESATDHSEIKDAIRELPTSGEPLPAAN